MRLYLLLEADITISGYIGHFLRLLSLSGFLYGIDRQIQQCETTESIVDDDIEDELIGVKSLAAEYDEDQSGNYYDRKHQHQPVNADFIPAARYAAPVDHRHDETDNGSDDHGGGESGYSTSQISVVNEMTECDSYKAPKIESAEIHYDKYYYHSIDTGSLYLAQSQGHQHCKSCKHQ